MRAKPLELHISRLVVTAEAHTQCGLRHQQNRHNSRGEGGRPRNQDGTGARSTPQEVALIHRCITLQGGSGSDLRSSLV